MDRREQSPPAAAGRALQHVHQEYPPQQVGPGVARSTAAPPPTGPVRHEPRTSARPSVHGAIAVDGDEFTFFVDSLVDRRTAVPAFPAPLPPLI